jgi:hypothetical protein
MRLGHFATGPDRDAFAGVEFDLVVSRMGIDNFTSALGPVSRRWTKR